MDFSGMIERARRSAQLSQRELAERAGTSAAAICLYERGERVPRVDTFVRILDATGAVVDVAVEMEGSMIDPDANGRDLRAVLDLADRLPGHFDEELPYPIFRDLATSW